MGKPSKNRNLPDNCAMALDRSIRSSAQKLNLVAESIRGMDASKALIQLEFSKKRIATDVKKVYIVGKGRSRRATFGAIAEEAGML